MDGVLMDFCDEDIDDSPLTLEEMEVQGREIARALTGALPAQTGFAVMLFDLGEGKNLTWISNARREDMVKVLDEFKERLKHGAANTAASGVS